MPANSKPVDVPPFAPRIFHEPGVGEAYEDGRMVGTVDTRTSLDGRIIVILEWQAEHRGQGHSVQALRWLRAQGFTRIIANGVGLVEDGVGDIATTYWMHMHELGLVDVLLDDHGQDITPTRKL